MFAKATKNLVSEIDTDGSLIPVSRLNDSDGLAPLALVIKRNCYWFWQQPKYLTSDFKLNDVLVGDPINPAVVESDFLTYNGKVVDNKSGSAAAEFGPGTINVGGAGSSKLQSSFGNLKKEEVDVQKLLQDSKSRVLDLKHSLIEQTRESQREVLTLVKERIVTTQPCTVTEDVQEGGTCTGMFGFNKTIKVSVNDKSKPFVEYDTNVSINIPPKTTIAYSVIELEVAHTGHYELCLLPNIKGGFEVDGPVKVKQSSTVSAAPGKTTNKLQKDLEGLQGQFTVLSKLPSSTRSALFQQISLLLQDSAAISVLEDALEDLCGGTQPDPIALEKVPALKATLELVQKTAGANPSGKQKKPSALTATHLLISSFDEMTDSALLELKSCCSYATLQALLHLVQNMTSNKKSSLKDAALAALTNEKVFKKVTSLFASCNVTLLKEKDSVVTKIGKPQDRLPLMLCIAVKGLASLVPPV
ncbi:gasdermin Eb isoform X1 [Sinocyclocheilus grahami]|uniref:Gasdermin Eb n=1 Tax=Sinocyclocheilus grahami TaxID=75366 RepID=A0A672MMT2_SINGR|nr:PREDICTED: non-syndromic hearing impairment protein 5 isoform X1 [Sinocyclocheilus grahami]